MLLHPRGSMLLIKPVISFRDRRGMRHQWNEHTHTHRKQSLENLQTNSNHSSTQSTCIVWLQTDRKPRGISVEIWNIGRTHQVRFRITESYGVAWRTDAPLVAAELLKPVRLMFERKTQHIWVSRDNGENNIKSVNVKCKAITVSDHGGP
jgi:hypothetical protein